MPSAAYFCFITLTTIGFGDYSPKKSFEMDPDHVFSYIIPVLAISYCVLGQLKGQPYIFFRIPHYYYHRRAPLLLEGTQEKFRVREILKVLSTESYCTDSRIRLGTGAYRQQIPFPFPASPHHSQEGTNQPHSQSTY